jgi:RNA polymerase sigma-70 factor (ECF subfamily)
VVIFYFCLFKIPFDLKFQHPDIFLFQRLKKGNLSALTKLYDKYFGSLCNFAFLFLKDTMSAEEIVDDVFIHIWENREKLFIKTNVKSYLYRSTRNGVISHLRKNKTRFEALQLLDNKNQGARFPLAPDTIMIRKEIASRIETILQQLPPQAGLVFRLHKVDGMRYAEIAEVLDISIKTVENHMGRALKIFRRIYDENASFFDD